MYSRSKLHWKELQNDIVFQPPKLLLEISSVGNIVTEQRLWLDPIDDDPVDGDGDLKLDVWSFIEASRSKLQQIF